MQNESLQHPSLINLIKIPDIITFTALLAGVLSVYLILEKNQIALGLFVLFISGILDMADGTCAKLLHMERKFGEYLDFMNDTIVYIGFIPIICYKLGVTSFIILALYMISACIRHARQLAYPSIKRQGVSTTSSALSIPVLFVLCSVSGLQVSLSISILLIALTIGMLLSFKTTFYDRAKERFIRKIA